MNSPSVVCVSLVRSPLHPPHNGDILARSGNADDQVVHDRSPVIKTDILPAFEVTRYALDVLGREGGGL